MHKSHKKKKSGGGKKHQNKSQSKKSSDTESIATVPEDSSVNDIQTRQAAGKRNVTYDVATSEIMGRYVVAARDLKAGSIIVNESPLVVGPCSACALCLGCYQKFDQDKIIDSYKCTGCGWPLCGPKCFGINAYYGHSKAECLMLQQANKSRKLNLNNYKILKTEYTAIVPLRCLLLKTENPEKWEELMTMEAHNSVRKKIPELWSHNQLQVVERIREYWGFKQFSEEEIHTVCGILEVNAFEIGQNGISIRGTYPSAFLLAHDCVPNTTHTDEEQTYKIIIRASVDIPKGESITLSYAYTLQSTLKRREHLLESKFFSCVCRRCSDPTELGTYAGALKCPKCHTGLVLSSNPLDNQAPWECNKKGSPNSTCPGYTVSAKSMKLLMEKIWEEVESIEIHDVEGYEAFLKKYCNVLHPTHYHCLGVKHNLCQLYGKIPDYMIHELPIELLHRKRDICREILAAFDILEPGYSRLRGVTLYEYHAPLMILTTRDFESRSITKGDLRIRLKEIVKYLDEASVILGFEPLNSSEGLMSMAAKDALLRIRDWQKFLGKI